MKFFKTGCRWGSKTDKKPLFFDMLLEKNMIISECPYKCKKGDLVLMSDGYKILGIAEVLEDCISVTKDSSLKPVFQKYEIYYNSNILFAPARIMKLTANQIFEYKAQKGIHGVRKPSIIKQAQSLFII